MTSRNKVDYNFDNIFTNIDSSSSSFNNYYDALPNFFGIRRFRREALEDGDGVGTMDQDRSARSFQRARQNGLISSRYQMMGHVKQPRLTENNREMSEQMEDMLLQQRMELLEDQLMREQLIMEDTNLREQALLQQRQMKERERMENENLLGQRFMDQRNMNDQTHMDQRNQRDQYRMDQSNEMEQNLMDSRNLMSERMLEDKNLM